MGGGGDGGNGIRTQVEVLVLRRGRFPLTLRKGQRKRSAKITQRNINAERGEKGGPLVREYEERSGAHGRGRQSSEF